MVSLERKIRREPFLLYSSFQLFKETFSFMLATTCCEKESRLQRKNDRPKTTAVNDKEELRLLGTSPANNGLDESQNDCKPDEYKKLSTKRMHMNYQVAHQCSSLERNDYVHVFPWCKVRVEILWKCVYTMANSLVPTSFLLRCQSWQSNWIPSNRFGCIFSAMQPKNKKLFISPGSRSTFSQRRPFAHLGKVIGCRREVSSYFSFYTNEKMAAEEKPCAFTRETTTRKK